MTDLFESEHVNAALYLTDLGHYLFKFKEGNKAAVKNLREAEVKAAFTGVNDDSGWIRSGIVRIGNNVKGPFFVYYRTRELKAMHFDDKSEFIICLPPTVLIGANGKFKLFALREEGFTKDAIVYCAPFPNVDPSDGRICWGTNDKPKVNPSKAEKVWELFFNSLFNDHLTDKKSKSHPKDIRKLYKFLEEEGVDYPLDDLVTTHKSIDEITENLIGAKHE